MIGKAVKFNGVDLLVLDETSKEYFVWAYNTGVKSIFNHEGKGNKYEGSDLQISIGDWAANMDLLFNNPSPLTKMQYNKYKDIMKPYIKEPFWLKDSDDSTYSACGVYGGGGPYNAHYSDSFYVAPAFYISKRYIGNRINNAEREKEEGDMDKEKKLYYFFNWNESALEDKFLLSEESVEFFKFLQEKYNIAEDYSLIKEDENIDPTEF